MKSRASMLQAGGSMGNSNQLQFGMAHAKLQVGTQTDAVGPGMGYEWHKMHFSVRSNFMEPKNPFSDD